MQHLYGFCVPNHWFCESQSGFSILLHGIVDFPWLTHRWKRPGACSVSSKRPVACSVSSKRHCTTVFWKKHCRPLLLEETLQATVSSKKHCRPLSFGRNTAPLVFCSVSSNWSYGKTLTTGLLEKHCRPLVFWKKHCTTACSVSSKRPLQATGLLEETLQATVFLPLVFWKKQLVFWKKH